MALVVNDMKTRFNIEIAYKEEKLIFTFRQLTYKEKNIITGLTTEYKQGQAVVDTSLTCFYTLKYGLIDVHGLVNADGTKFDLEKEEGGEVNTDDCIDTLLNAPVSNGLIFAANNMLQGIPTEITHPLTGKKINGIEIVKIDPPVKKKS